MYEFYYDELGKYVQHKHSNLDINFCSLEIDINVYNVFNENSAEFDTNDYDRNRERYNIRNNLITN